MNLTLDNVLILDFEASGLAPDSWPTEIAWAKPGPDPGISHITDRLVKPMAHWTHWDPEAEKLTGITRHHLELCGTNPSEILSLLSADAEGRIILTDAPRHDAFWLRRLIDAATDETGCKSQPNFRFAEIGLLYLDLLDARNRQNARAGRAILDSADYVDHIERAIAAAKISHPPIHRAGDDVRHHLETIRHLLDL